MGGGGFRTLASTGIRPVEIATRMNAELSKNNEMGMFVTMFSCMYDLNEAENCQQEQYGEDRIIQLMTSHAS